MKIMIVPANDWIFGPKQYFHEIAEILAEKHEVFIWHFHLFRNVKPCFQEVKKVKLVSPRSIHSTSLLFYYAANFIPHTLHFTRVARELQIDVIIVLNLIPGLWAFSFAPSKTLKVFGFEDYYPESASIYYENSLPIFRRIIESFALIVNRLVVKISDLVLAPCLSLTDLSKKMGSKRNIFLPNGVDANFFTPSKIDEQLRNKLGLSNHTIVFFGLIENWLDFETVVDGLKLVKKEISDVKLLIIGSTLTGYSSVLKNLLKEKDLLDDVILTGYVPEELVPYYINLGDVCLMPYKIEQYSGKIRLPLKLFIYSAMAKPILSVPLPEVKRIMPNHVFYYSDAESFSNTAQRILHNEKLQKDLGTQARTFAKKFDYSILAEQCELILETHLKTKH